MEVYRDYTVQCLTHIVTRPRFSTNTHNTRGKQLLDINTMMLINGGTAENSYPQKYIIWSAANIWAFIIVVILQFTEILEY